MFPEALGWENEVEEGVARPLTRGTGARAGPTPGKAPEAGRGGPGGGRAASEERTQRELCPQREEAQGTPEPSLHVTNYLLHNCFYRNKTGDGGLCAPGRGVESNGC